MVKSNRIQEMAKKAVYQEHGNRLSKSSIIAAVCVGMFYLMQSPFAPIITSFLKPYSVHPRTFEFVLLVLGAVFGSFAMTRIYRGGGLIGAFVALICGYNLYVGLN